MSTPKKKPLAVKEPVPVQVYLDGTEKALLDRVAKRAGLSRAEVLRRGLRTFSAEVLADESAVLKLLADFGGADWPADSPTDLGVRHDEHLAEIYAEGHRPKKPGR